MAPRVRASEAGKPRPLNGDVAQNLIKMEKLMGSELTDSESTTASGMSSRSVRSVALPLEEGYDLLETLGQGAFAHVRAVVCKRTQKRYAAKVMDEGRQSKVELKFLAALRHRNIVQLYESREHSSKVYLIMDLCCGDLDKWISSHWEKDMNVRVYAPPARQQVASFLCQMLEAVSYLHDLGIVHRDVKPDNLLLLKAPRGPHLKLSDFNLAKEFESGEMLTEVAGTPGYMAPEVVKGCYSELCDTWSVGVIFYEMVSGLPLWKDPSREQHIEDLLTQTPLTLEYMDSAQAWRAFGPGARQLGQELLNLESNGRLSAAAALDHDWLRTSSQPEGCCTIS